MTLQLTRGHRRRCDWQQCLLCTLLAQSSEEVDELLPSPGASHEIKADPLNKLSRAASVRKHASARETR
ncbi:hypothetical protein JOB18_029503 [Solea senegalensis]|uniref:Secreted protein n=1 Tax=Solea senegalensis TaxID=28829 RepID=A0AAV6SG18_SOLSE|nr:hypothetical protein JOB18_029503 [Solea senegalensis]